MADSYCASEIIVLTGLEAVRRHPSMYTDTLSPHRLAQQVIDISAFDALDGQGSRIDVTLFQDGSLQVADDGPGLPLGIDPHRSLPGVEVLLTAMHSGHPAAAKQGLYIVNALSKRLDCWVRCEGKEHSISFRDGELHTGLTVTGSVDSGIHGTTLRFWPDPAFFERGAFSVCPLQHRLRALAALCPGLRVTLSNEATGGREAWRFTDGLSAYLMERLGQAEGLPAEPITGGCHADDAVVDYALCWTPAGQSVITESYVSLEPAPVGSHVDGLRAGITRALRGHSAAARLLRALSLAPEDLCDQTSFVLAVRSPGCGTGGTPVALDPSYAPLIEGVVGDSLARWLNLNPGAVERVVQRLVTTRAGRGAAQVAQAARHHSNPSGGRECTCHDARPAGLFSASSGAVSL